MYHEIYHDGATGLFVNREYQPLKPCKKKESQPIKLVDTKEEADNICTTLNATIIN